ncbi:MAG: magnesium transporter [Candidatus Hydrogenedentota bacterium]|nr:MAG: magnesium transporter [Candidatus Hydrogenedentota bacterium]
MLKLEEKSNSVEEQPLTDAELDDAWPLLDTAERVEGFRLLNEETAEDFFMRLPSSDQAELLLALPHSRCRALIRLLPPDDVSDLIQELPEERRREFLDLLVPNTRIEVQALLAYAEDVAGGLMNPRYLRVRPDMTVGEALTYLRRQIRSTEGKIAWAYVIDSNERLLGLVSFMHLLASDSNDKIKDIMKTDFISVTEETDQEKIGELFAEYDLTVMPVVDREGRMKGIITVDDVVDVVVEEATEDIHKMGGTDAFDEPYWRVSFREMIRKRGGWLTVLFLGEMLTASVMAYFEKEIAEAVVLALFLPLIISSGGNSGSQATTIIIRAMALGEVRLRDWWRILRREISVGFALGCLLGIIGFFRIILWHELGGLYGEHYLLLAVAVGISLVGVVMWGTITGSMLPFLLRSAGFDPASASAPFVATIVDVAGVLIYFTVAGYFLSGVLL